VNLWFVKIGVIVLWFHVINFITYYYAFIINYITYKLNN